MVWRALTLVMLLMPGSALAQTPVGATSWLVEGDVACPRIALIFNIGVGYPPSETILHTLIEQDVPATMFPMGSFARSQPEYLRRLDEAGFPIGTHGDTNLWLTDASNMDIRTDTLASVEAIEAVIGRPIDAYHTPFAGNADDRVRAVVATTGLTPVGWRVSAPDWSADATEEGVYNAVFHNAYPGAIIEMHLDGPATERSTALALPRLVDDLRARGFEFVTLGEMQEPCDAAGSHVPEAITISGLDVHGAHCKVAPSAGAATIRILLNGDVVTTRGLAFDGWMPVECADRDGWVKAAAILRISRLDPTPG